MTASRALAMFSDSSLFALCSTLLNWSVRLDLHQHLPGYEPDALAVKLQTNEMVGYPGAAPGASWSQTK